jgi:hypothetical protein
MFLIVIIEDGKLDFYNATSEEMREVLGEECTIELNVWLDGVKPGSILTNGDHTMAIIYTAAE